MDWKLIQSRANASADTYQRYAYVNQDIAHRMLERLAYMRMQPERVLDLACGCGYLAPALQKRYPRADIISLDFSFPRVQRCSEQRLCADVHALPLSDNSVDFIVCNSSLHLFTHVPMVFSECFRVLKNGGVMMLTTFGTDTLKEWRRVCRLNGLERSIDDFFKLSELGDMLKDAGFSDPVLDRELLSVPYDSVATMLSDRKCLGITNARTDKMRGLLTPRKWRRVIQAMEEVSHLSLELIQVQAWKMESGYYSANKQGEVSIPLSHLRRKRSDHG